MDCSTPGSPVHHQLPEFTQTQVHRVGDAISSSAIPFSSSPQSLPASGCFPKSQLFSGGGRSIGVSASASGVNSLWMDRLDLLVAQGTLKSLLQHYTSKASILWCAVFCTVLLSHIYMTTGKTIALTRQTNVGKVMCLIFDMLSRLVIAFLPSTKRLLISWVQSPSAMILELPQNKACHCFHSFPIYLSPKEWDRMHFLGFWMLSFKPTFSLSSFTFIQRLFSSSSLSAISVVSSAYLHIIIDIYFPGNLDSSLCFLQPSVSHDVFCI